MQTWNYHVVKTTGIFITWSLDQLVDYFIDQLNLTLNCNEIPIKLYNYEDTDGKKNALLWWELKKNDTINVLSNPWIVTKLLFYLSSDLIFFIWTACELSSAFLRSVNIKAWNLEICTKFFWTALKMFKGNLILTLTEKWMTSYGGPAKAHSISI